MNQNLIASYDRYLEAFNNLDPLDRRYIRRIAADLTYTVIYAEKYAQFMARDIDGDEVPLSAIVFSEVIGNIYDKKSIQD